VWGMEKNNPTCRKRRLKGKPSTWGFSWATLSLVAINSEAWSSRLGLGVGLTTPARKKLTVTRYEKQQSDGPI
jgi:hypothetical protein